MTESTRISHTLPKGYQLEDFEIEEVLGIGGFGITYKARDVHLNRPVAIKEYMPSGMAVRDKEAATVFPASDSHKDDFEWGLDRFRKEAETLVSFRHPNIVSVYRFFRANGTAYLVMEYEDGKSLADILGASNTLSEGEVDEIIYPLLDGLEQVHDAGFMHRDIKPANIFIRRDGQPVLIDFGAARQALGGHSQALTSIVTAGYAPYEQYESDSVQGPWSDIYALGATLYRAVTGVRPVEAPKRAGAVMRGEPDPNEPVAEVAKGKYSATLLTAIDAALNVLEGQRPQSVAEFRNYLMGMARAEADTEVNAQTAPGPAGEGATLYVGGAVRASEPTAPTAPTAPPAVAAPAPPPPAAAWPATAATAPTAEPSHTPTYPPPDAGPKSSKKALIWALVGLGAFVVIGGAAAGVYFIDQQQQADADAARRARDQKLAEEQRKAAELEAKRKAELKRQQDLKRQEADRKKREEDQARRNNNGINRNDPEQEVKPNDNDSNNTNNNNNNSQAKKDPLPNAPTVGAPGGLIGRWCSPRSHITFSARSMAIRNLKSNWTVVYHVNRYNITPTVVTIYFTGSAKVGNGIFVFSRERHSTIRMTLTRAYFGKRWRSFSTYFSRSC